MYNVLDENYLQSKVGYIYNIHHMLFSDASVSYFYFTYFEYYFSTTLKSTLQSQYRWGWPQILYPRPLDVITQRVHFSELYIFIHCSWWAGSTLRDGKAKTLHFFFTVKIRFCLARLSNIVNYKTISC